MKKESNKNDAKTTIYLPVELKAKLLDKLGKTDTPVSKYIRRLIENDFKNQSHLTNDQQN